MTKTYIDSCIEEALAQAFGNRTKAAQILIARCMQDKLLEDGLFANFREAVTMAHVQRVSNKKDQKTARVANAGNASVDTQSLGEIMLQMEKNWMRADPMSASTLKSAPASSAKPEGSAGHGSNLKAIADAFKKPSKKPTST